MGIETTYKWKECEISFRLFIDRFIHLYLSDEDDEQESIWNFLNLIKDEMEVAFPGAKIDTDTGRPQGRYEYTTYFSAPEDMGDAGHMEEWVKIRTEQIYEKLLKWKNMDRWLVKKGEKLNRPFESISSLKKLEKGGVKEQSRRNTMRRVMSDDVVKLVKKVEMYYEFFYEGNYQEIPESLADNIIKVWGYTHSDKDMLEKFGKELGFKKGDIDEDDFDDRGNFRSISLGISQSFIFTMKDSGEMIFSASFQGGDWYDTLEGEDDLITKRSDQSEAFYGAFIGKDWDLPNVHSVDDLYDYISKGKVESRQIKDLKQMIKEAGMDWKVSQDKKGGWWVAHRDEAGEWWDIGDEPMETEKEALEFLKIAKKESEKTFGKKESRWDKKGIKPISENRNLQLGLFRRVDK